jgi:hypothetical protein
MSGVKISARTMNMPLSVNSETRTTLPPAIGHRTENFLQRVANSAITDRANQNFLSRRALAYRISFEKNHQNAVQLV